MVITKTSFWRRIIGWFKDDIFRRLFANAGKLLSANATAAVLGIITAIITARFLGPENYGILALVLVYKLTVGIFFSFNAWQAIIKFGSAALQVQDRVAFRQLIKFGFTLDVASAVIGTFVAIAFSGPMIMLLGWDYSIRPLLMIYSLLILFSPSGTSIGVLRLFDRFDLLSYTSIFNSLIILLSVFLCLLTGQGLFGFVLGYLLAGITGQLYLLIVSIWVLQNNGIVKIIGQPLRGISTRFNGIWDYVWTTNVNSTIRMFSREADLLVIGALTTPAVLGIYKIAKQFASALPMLIDPLYQSIYPELSRFWAAENRSAFFSMIKRSTFIVSSIALTGWLGFLLLGKWLITITVGVDYLGAYTVASVYLIAQVLAMGGFVLQPAMLATGLPYNSFKAQTTATVFYLLLLFPMINYLSILGAAISYIVYYIIWTMLMIGYLRPVLWIRNDNA